MQDKPLTAQEAREKTQKKREEISGLENALGVISAAIRCGLYHTRVTAFEEAFLTLQALGYVVRADQDPGSSDLWNAKVSWDKPATADVPRAPHGEPSYAWSSVAEAMANKPVPPVPTKEVREVHLSNQSVALLMGQSIEAAVRAAYGAMEKCLPYDLSAAAERIARDYLHLFVDAYKASKGADDEQF